MAHPSLRGRRIIVGVSGSIACYKAVLLVRLLVKAGAEVRVLMSPAATKFVAPLTFSTLSKHEVLTSVVSEAGWNDHVALGLWADAYVIAPATANTLARLAHGICDSILAAVYLSARCPVFFAPAMDVDMWQHPSTQANIQRLEGYGNTIIPVGEGELASGLSGAGRLAEPEEIVACLQDALNTSSSTPSEALLLGKRVLVTAGPTHEPIDPVRFIGNHSSGKMGLALTHALLDAGAEVTLILGPISLPVPIHQRLQLTRVTTAEEMYQAALEAWSLCDAGILAAAVADYRPVAPAEQKLKKSEETLQLDLVRNPDIAADLGQRKQAHQRLIGFALETSNGEQHALGKLERKRLDAIVLNLHTPEATAFGGDQNQVTLLFADGRQASFERMAKADVAAEVVKSLATLG